MRQVKLRCTDAHVVHNHNLKYLVHLWMNVTSQGIRHLNSVPAAWQRTTLLTVLLLSGCEGRNLVSDNPVFSDLPPRRSLQNRATQERSSGKDRRNDFKQVALITSSQPLKGNTVVAEINGHPLFVDDLIGSVRLTLEGSDQFTDSQRQQVMLEQLRIRLDQRVEEEIVLQALEIKVPEEQRDALNEHIGKTFEQFLDTRTSELIAEDKIKSADELDQFLAQGGMSVDLLRETFFRTQMVNGFVQSLCEQVQDGAPDRLQLLDYYHEHIDEFTPKERLRWQEIRTGFQEHGGRTQAKQRMLEVLKHLKSGQTEFGAIAREFSDSLSSKDNGNRGWLSRGALRDKKLEEALFALPGGGTTSVMEKDDSFSIYRIARHEYAQPRPFVAVQSEIEQLIREKSRTAARQKVIDDLRADASVHTIFDENSELQADVSDMIQDSGQSGL